MYKPNFCPTCGQKKIVKETVKVDKFETEYSDLYYCKNNNCGLTYFQVNL